MTGRALAAVALGAAALALVEAAVEAPRESAWSTALAFAAAAAHARRHRLVAAGLLPFVAAALVRALWPAERVTQQIAGEELTAVTMLTGAVVLAVAVSTRPAARSTPRRALGLFLMAAVPLVAWSWGHLHDDHLSLAFAAPAALTLLAGLVIAALAGWRTDPGLRAAIGGALLALAAAATLDHLNALCWTTEVLSEDRGNRFLNPGMMISTTSAPAGLDAWDLLAAAAFVLGPLLLALNVGESVVVEEPVEAP